MKKRQIKFFKRIPLKRVNYLKDERDTCSFSGKTPSNILIFEREER